MNKKDYFIDTKLCGKVKPPEILCEFELYGRKYFCSRAIYTDLATVLTDKEGYKFYANNYRVTECETGACIGIDFNTVEDCIVYAMFLTHANGKRSIERHIATLKRAYSRNKK